ncbi:MAG: cyclase family protein [Firmicutes bacterium]|jgi:arylformamidase|nr:cyclase family protein [Bacillota bacterium]
MKIKKVYDLSRPLYHNCPGWPGFELTKVEKFMFKPQDMATVERVTSLTHVATHADTPLHFFEDGSPMDKVPAGTWVGEGVVVDVPGKKDKEFITYDDLDKAGAHVKEGDIVALRTGYGQYYGFNRKYLYDWPAIDKTGAEWMVERKVKVIGCDTIGIESYGFPAGGPVVHQTLLRANIMIVEELNLEEIVKFGTKRWLFCWLPILLQNAGGCFTRAVAIDVE